MELGDGKVKLEFLGHAGFFVSCKKKVAIDPYNVSSKVLKADIILITHGHYDHCSIKDIAKVADNGTVVVCPVDCQSKIMKVKGVDIQVVEVGDVLNFGDVKIEAFPAYNKKSSHHPKNEGWFGYVLKIDEVIIYYSGDSDYIPEMQRLSGYGKHGNEFVALLSVSGEQTMDADEAAEVASILSPHLAIPMSYGAGVYGTLEDAEHFVKLCKEKNIKSVILEKI